MKIVFQNHKKPEWDLPTPGYFFHIKDPRIDSNNYHTYVLIGHYLIQKQIIRIERKRKYNEIHNKKF